jgi:hypothetical protein
MSEGQTSVRQKLLPTFAIALALNYAWEMLQMSAYGRLSQSQARVWLFCGMAAAADALYTGLLYWLGARVTHEENWIARLSWRRASVVAVLGIISAVSAEWLALSLGVWRYGAEMVIVPILRVGLLPILQLAFLPLVTFWLVGRIASHEDVPKS